MGVAKNVGFETFPKQGAWLGKRTRVCFRYDPSHVVMGTIVRDDNEEPWRTIISLDDGRVVLATECMHSPEIPVTDPSPLGEAPRLRHAFELLQALRVYVGFMRPFDSEPTAVDELEIDRSMQSEILFRLKEIETILVAEGAARRGPPCQTCQGRGWVMHTEHHDLGNGLASGGAWNEPCPDCALVRSSAPPQPQMQETKDDKNVSRLQSGATTCGDRIHADTSNGDK